MPGVFIIWNIASICILGVWGNRLPAAATNVFSLAYAVYLPALLVLRPLGLSQGTYWNGPTTTGMILAAIVYMVILFFIGKGIQRLLNWHD